MKFVCTLDIYIHETSDIARKLKEEKLKYTIVYKNVMSD